MYLNKYDYYRLVYLGIATIATWFFLLPWLFTEGTFGVILGVVVMFWWFYRLGRTVNHFIELSRK